MATYDRTQMRLLFYPNHSQLVADTQLQAARVNCLALDFGEPESGGQRLHQRLASRGVGSANGLEWIYSCRVRLPQQSFDSRSLFSILVILDS